MCIHCLHSYRTTDKPKYWETGTSIYPYSYRAVSPPIPYTITGVQALLPTYNLKSLLALQHTHTFTGQLAHPSTYTLTCLLQAPHPPTLLNCYWLSQGNWSTHPHTLIPRLPVLSRPHSYMATGSPTHLHPRLLIIFAAYIMLTFLSDHPLTRYCAKIIWPPLIFKYLFNFILFKII